MAIEGESGTVPNLLLLMNNLASVLDLEGKTLEAEAVLRDVIRLSEDHWPEGHWRVGSAYGGLGAFHLVSGDTAAAEGDLRRALDITAETLGDDNIGAFDNLSLPG